MLRRQRGNCFDCSVLLCSLLVGVGFDAYCVCGYADQEVTLLNQTRRDCPPLRGEEKVCTISLRLDALSVSYQVVRVHRGGLFVNILWHCNYSVYTHVYMCSNSMHVDMTS